LFDILLPFFLELLKLHVILHGSFLKIFILHRQLCFQFIDFRTIQLLYSSQFVLQLIVFRADVLVLMEEVVYLKLELGSVDVLATELVLQFNQLILELYSEFALIVEVVLVFVLCLFELFPLVLQHQLDLAHVVVIVGTIVCIDHKFTSIGVAKALADVTVAESWINVLVIAWKVVVSIVHFKLILSNSLINVYNCYRLDLIVWCKRKDL
jgi:hypothetical protein